MSPSALILFAHGARDPEWARPVQRVAGRVRALAPALRVEVAFLELMTPSLDATIDALVAEGCHDLRVVPVFLAQGGHLKRDLPRLIEAARQRHPAVMLELAPALGEGEGVIEAMARQSLAGIDGSKG